MFDAAYFYTTHSFLCISTEKKTYTIYYEDDVELFWNVKYRGTILGEKIQLFMRCGNLFFILSQLPALCTIQSYGSHGTIR